MTKTLARRPDTTLFISSSQGKGNSHDFITKYNSIIRLNPNNENYIKLHETSMTYSWYNIDAKYNNSSIKYAFNSVNYDISFPNGNYSFKDINSHIQTTLEANGHDPSGINIFFDSVEFKCVLELQNSFKMVFGDGKFKELVGFTGNEYSSTAKGEALPNITRSMDSIQVRCSIASCNVNGSISNVLYQFSTQDLVNSYPFSKKPIDIGDLYGVCNATEISEIRIQITNQLGRSIDMNNQEVSLTLLIRECEN